MICLDDTDVIEGGASVDAVVEYTIHGLVSSAFTQLAAGVMNTTLTAVLYTAPSAVSVVSIILVNTHSAAVSVTLRLDPADGDNPRYLIPKTISLGIGYSLHTDGARITVMDASGRILKGYAAHAAEHKAGGADDLLSAPGAIGGTTPAAGAFTTLSASGLISANGGQIKFPATAVPSADPNTIDDYERGTWEPSVGGNATYHAQDGRYVKTGDSVSFQVFLRINVIGTGSVNTISGLPFASAAAPINSGALISIFHNLTANVVSIAAYIAASGTTMAITKTAAAAASVTAPANLMGDSTQLLISTTYFV